MSTPSIRPIPTATSAKPPPSSFLPMPPLPKGYSIRRLSSSSPQDVSAYRRLRLLSLEVDPQGFGSSLEKELKFNEDIWRDRTGNHWMIFAKKMVAGDTGVDGLKGLENQKNDQLEDGSKADDNHEGEGVALVGAVLLYPDLKPPQQVLASTWVAPSHRGLALAKHLLRACILSVVFDQGHQLILTAEERNPAAKALYESMGFEINNEINLEEKQVAEEKAKRDVLVMVWTGGGSENRKTGG